MAVRPFLRLSLIASIALGGCNLAPTYVRPGGAVPLALPQGGIYPAAIAGALDITRVGWHDFFTDDRLRQVIQRGLDNNQDLALAAANVLRARAQYHVQRADLLPTIAANGSATYTNSLSGATPRTGAGGDGSDSVSNYSATVGVSAFELDLFGKVRNLSKAALEQYFATEEAQRSSRISLIAEIATAWLTIAADQDQLALSRRTLKTFDETLRLTTAQFRIGVKSELEARQAETNYQAARNDIAVLQTRIAQDRNALDLLVGKPVEPGLLPAALGDGRPAIEVIPTDLSSNVLLRRPDVLQAEHQLIAQNANIGAARAAFFPTISLTGVLGTISPSLSGLFGGGSFTYSAGPGIALPLFDGGRNKGNLAYALASRQAAVATYQRAVQVAFREVADALVQRGTIDEQIAAQSARANAAQVAARLSDARYRAGVDSFLTALDAERTAYAAQQQLVTTRLARGANLVELYRALGGGLN